MQAEESVLVVLDTNVMIHCRPLVELPWAALIGTRNVRLAITPSVLREIDKLKQDGNLRRAKRARRAIPLIRSCEESGGTTPLRDGIVFSLLTDVMPDWDNQVFGQLDKSHADDRLVAEAWTIQDCGDRVHFVCNDTLARVRAASLGLVVTPIPDDWILSEEPDERDKEIAELRAFKKNTENKKPLPFVEFEGADSKGSLRLNKVRFLPPESAWIEARVRSYLATHPKQVNASLNLIDLGAFASGSTGLTKVQIDAYFDSYEAFVREVREYFTIRVVEALNSDCSLLRLDLTIGNRGGIPAEGFQLRIESLNGGSLLSTEREARFPRPPKPPLRPKSAFEQLTDPIHSPQYLTGGWQHLPSPNFATRRFAREPEELVWDEEPDKHEPKPFISMRCDLVRHGSTIYKRSFVYQLPVGCSSGEILATISCTNLSQETSTRLNFHVVYEEKDFLAASEKSTKPTSGGIRIDLNPDQS